jgi:arylsulfatase A-like enzyme
MSRRFLQTRGILVLGCLVLIGVFVGTQFRIVSPLRRTGTIEDLANLQARDDVNVVFVVIDTLRADHLGTYGYHRDTSPHLDELANHGVRFSNHLAQSSWTKTSMASLWTGLYPARTGVLRYSHAVADEARMPAEVFHDAGFRTAAIWRNGWVAPNFGFSQGFEYYMRPENLPLTAAAWHENPAARLPGSDLDVVRSAEEFLRTLSRDERWFLYLHLMDVHQYVSDLESARFGTSGYIDFYDNSIHWTDRVMAELTRVLTERDLLKRTLIVIVSDHGEAFLEHGSEGHAKNLYGEVTETPFILSLPFSLEPGWVVDTPSQNVDVWPTLFDLLGLPQPDESDGRSLLPDILAAASGAHPPPDERPRISHLDRHWGRTEQAPSPTMAVTLGQYRGITSGAKAETFELYDLVNDPGESRNLAEREPEKSAELMSKLSKYRDESTSLWITPEVELDDMQLNQLRALGYKID